MKIIDTHSHILSSSYNDEFKQIIQENKIKNIISFNISFDINSSKEVIEIFKKHKNLIPVIGIHPCSTMGWNKNMLNQIEKLITSDIVALGEIGLDYHHDGYNKKEQKIAFIKQIELAKKYNLPIVIHTRDSLEDCYEIIKNYPNQKFLLHSWSGDVFITKKYINISKNIYFSFNGIITFKNADIQKRVIKIIPLNRIMFETDCPYLTPVPFRGQKNYPWNVKNVIEFVSDYLKISFEKLNENNNKVALDFFNVKKELLK
ncbi:MAG: TatD family hydrolase [Mycoplasmataceae bacterium]|nr:TatD family hydrolase [Mycoplasmataceae bacterium]